MQPMMQRLFPAALHGVMIAIRTEDQGVAGFDFIISALLPDVQAAGNDDEQVERADILPAGMFAPTGSSVEPLTI